MKSDIPGHDEALSVIQLLEITVVLERLLDNLDPTVAPFGTINKNLIFKQKRQVMTTNEYEFYTHMKIQ